MDNGYCSHICCHIDRFLLMIYFKFTQIKHSFTIFFDNIFFIQSCDLYALTLRENGFNSLDPQPRCVFLERSGIPIHKNLIENFIFDYWETHCNEAGTVLTYRTIFFQRERESGRRIERVRQTDRESQTERRGQNMQEIKYTTSFSRHKYTENHKKQMESHILH